jgi:hypothetical protein
MIAFSVAGHLVGSTPALHADCLRYPLQSRDSANNSPAACRKENRDQQALAAPTAKPQSAKPCPSSPGNAFVPRRNSPDRSRPGCIVSTAANNTGVTVPHQGVITVSIMLAPLIQSLDSTIANVALPHMQACLSAPHCTQHVRRFRQCCRAHLYPDNIEVLDTAKRSSLEQPVSTRSTRSICIQDG